MDSQQKISLTIIALGFCLLVFMTLWNLESQRYEKELAQDKQSELARQFENSAVIK